MRLDKCSLHRSRSLGRVLIVDDDGSELPSLKQLLLSLGASEVDVLTNCGQARAALGLGYHLVMTEVRFRDGTTCKPVLSAVGQLQVPPWVLAMSNRAERRLVADVIGAGARGYVEKPVERAALAGQLQGLFDHVDLCRRLAQRLVGHVGLKEAQWYLRGLMNREALVRTGGNLRAAAQLLQVDRRYVGRLAEEFQSERFAPRG